MRRFLKYEQLKPEKGIDYSKPHLWRLQQLPTDDPRKFPDPIKGLGAENSYAEDEVDRYLNRRVAAAKAVLAEKQ